MIKIGITGSLASGKTTASKILSHRRGPLFSADKIVNNLYKKNSFIKLLMKKKMVVFYGGLNMAVLKIPYMIAKKLNGNFGKLFMGFGTI